MASTLKNPKIMMISTTAILIIVIAIVGSMKLASKKEMTHQEITEAKKGAAKKIAAEQQASEEKQGPIQTIVSIVSVIIFAGILLLLIGGRTHERGKF